MSAALAGTAHPARLTRVTDLLVRGRTGDPLGLKVLLRLAERGRFDVAAAVLAVAVGETSEPFDGGDGGARLGRRVRELDGARIGVLFDLVTWLDDTEVMTLFAARLLHADDDALLHRLFRTMEEQKRLDLLGLRMSAGLRRALTDRRRSRRQ